MASSKFNRQQISVYARQAIAQLKELDEMSKTEDSLMLDCQLRKIENDIESLRFRVDDLED